MKLQILDVTTIDFDKKLFNETANTSGAPYWLQFVQPHLAEIGVETPLLSLNQIDKSKNWIISLAPLSWNWKGYEGNILHSFTPEVQHELTNGNAFLLINHECESFTRSFYKQIHDVLAQTTLKPEKIIYMVSAPDAEREYERFVSDRLLFNHEKISILNSSHVYKRLVYPLDNFEYNRMLPKERKFLSLNRTGRDHRIMLVSLLTYHGLLEHGYVSMGIHQEEIPQILSDLNRLKVPSEVLTGFAQVRDRLPLKIDDIDLKTNQFKVDSLPTSFYEKSYFSVVSSTFALSSREPSVGFTEKEIKPILYKHPFIIQNLPGVLKHMRSMGFLTFGKWFDESYDDEHDDFKRLNKIVAEIKRLSMIPNNEWNQMLDEMQPVLLHNYNRLVKYNTEHCFFNSDLKNLLYYVS